MQKSILILIDPNGFLVPIQDRMEIEGFPGKIVRTYRELDTVETVKQAGVECKCIVITDPFVASNNTIEGEPTSGTLSMVKQLAKVNSNCRVFIYSGDFFELDKKLTKDEVDFINAYSTDAHNKMCAKIMKYAT